MFRKIRRTYMGFRWLVCRFLGIHSWRKTIHGTFCDYCSRVK